MESKMKTGLVAMVLMIFMIATLADSAVTVGVMVDGGMYYFPRKLSGGNGVCLVKDKPCKTHEDCPPDCACYTAGHCGDWVG